MQRLTPTEMDGLVRGGGPVLIDLRADWCTQCGPQEQVLDRLAPEYAGQVAIGSIDLGTHPTLADDYDVKGLPAFLLFTNGMLTTTLSGFRRAPELRIALAELLARREA